MSTKQLQKRADELSEAGCDWAEAKQVIEREIGEKLTETELQVLWTQINGI